jgi:hypothetical protein
MGHAQWDAGKVRRSSPLGVGLPLVVCVALLGCGGGESARQPPPKPATAPATAPAATSSSWSSAVKRGVLAGEYRISPVGDAFFAVNRAKDLRAKWSKSGVSAWAAGIDTPAAKDSQVSLKTISIKRGDSGRVFGNPEYGLGGCRSDGVKDEHGACLKRIERDLGGVQEWWENRGDGIAQGFVVSKSPGGKAGASRWLRVEVGVSGAHIDLAPGSDRAILTSAGEKFSYAGLKAWDADKKVLPTRMRKARSSLLLEVDDRNARYPIVIDPVLTKNVWEFESNSATVAGFAAGVDMVVSRAHDVNNDTWEDILVAFPRHNAPALNDTGVVYLFLGSPTGPSLTPAWTSEGTDVANAVAGPLAGALYGRSITAGYINGDAFADVVVGQVNYGNGEGGEGRVYVFFGQAGVSPLPALANRVIEGRSVNAFFGRSVALANLDNMGANADDLIVGSSGFSASTGRVEIYYNNGNYVPGVGGFPADAAPEETILGAAVSRLGLNVAAGDTNNDGRPDVLAAASTYSLIPGSNEGAIYALVTDVAGRVNEAAPFIFPGDVAGVQLSTVAFAGDVNGDTFGDVVGGAPQRASASGAAYVLYGTAAGITAAGVTTLVGHNTGLNFGAAVAGPVNVDNDGFFDVIVGSPGYDTPGADSGGVFVFRGSATGPVALNTAAIDNDSRFFGEDFGDQLGSTVAVAGDFNKDGFGDILAGAAGYEDGAETDEGNAYLFSGGLSTAKMDGAICTLNGECNSGFCVDGFCCNTICGGTASVEADNTTDCSACSMALSGAANGICDPIPAASTCTSNNACLMNGVCDAIGGCTGGIPKVCTAIPDGCHDPGVCDPGTGICSNPVKANNTACDDGNACTTGETCQTGACTPGTTVTCAAAPACKMPGICNTTTGVCDYANIPDGTTCTDANMCTTGDICTAGVCVPGTPTVCAVATMCKAPGVCDTSTGVCSQANLPDGTVCTDGDMCTVTDTCVAGACSSGAARNCDDSNVCTTDSCVVGTGCLNVPIVGCPVVDAGVDADVPPEVAPEVPDVAPDTPDVPPDVPDVRPPDVPDAMDMRDMTPTETAPDLRDVAAPDLRDTAPVPDSGVDVPRDTSGRDSRGVKVGGGGCDCEVGGSETNGTIQLSILVGLALVVSRIRRRRK